ncbi:MAG: nucleotidyl transferase AbiEii/AbiGii toxin family protein [Candidatus Wallbacteria bacterium]|nr:nucleotidyl transferase AbiEii/AbiGii toxin family protein [Candidatus Wallbacteria bacterium]
MIHENRADFVRMLELTMRRTGFILPLLEKDYFLTLILSRVCRISEGLIFKGGTCLNKIYFSYFRLSEDLDFCMLLPDGIVTRGTRRRCILPVRENIARLAEEVGMKVEGLDSAGRNLSRQYVFELARPSMLRKAEVRIKLEIGLRSNPICLPEKKKVQHVFRHPFTDAELFDAGSVMCLALDEVVAEKMRAAALRQKIAPRDFYDLDFLIRNGVVIAAPEVIRLFRLKLAEDGADSDPGRYEKDLGRSSDEIRELWSRIEDELLGVLTLPERKVFRLDDALKRINLAMTAVGKGGEAVT